MKKTERFIALMMQDLKRHKVGRLPAWCRGVNDYAAEIAEEIAENMRRGYISPDDLCNPKMRERAMLNGAANWSEYSWGGCSLIYDGDIAKRLCSPSDLKKTGNGTRRPNRMEEWLDVQARALYQASLQVASALKYAYEETA